MAEPAIIDGNLINNARPVAVEQQGAMPLPVGAATLAEQQVQSALLALVSTLAEQQTQTTALQLIDNLITALASVATDQLRVDIIAELPAGTQNIGDVDVLTEPSGDGSYTTPTLAVIGVGVASTAVIAANVNRLYALVVNDSDTTIYLSLGAVAIVGSGIRINANGGSYEMSAKLGNLYTGAINGIHGGAGAKDVGTVEGV